jgi:hypothetical protein
MADARMMQPVRITDPDTNNEANVSAAGNLAVEVAVALPAGTNNIGDVDVLTVPAPLSTTGGGTEATALRVTVATDSTGVLSVDDNGGSLTVDGGKTNNNAAPGIDNVGVLPAVATAAVPTQVEGRLVALSTDLSGYLRTASTSASVGTLTTVYSSTSSVTLLASNAARRGMTLFNDTSAATLFVKFGSSAAIDSFSFMLRPRACFFSDVSYTGQIDGVWSMLGGAVRITELT